MDVYYSQFNIIVLCLWNINDTPLDARGWNVTLHQQVKNIEIESQEVTASGNPHSVITNLRVNSNYMEVVKENGLYICLNLKQELYQALIFGSYIILPRYSAN